MPNLLVLDANQRSALAVIRSLGKLADTGIYAADSSTEAIGGCSKFCQKYLVSPSLSKRPAEFADWIRQTIQQESIDLVFPVTEKSSQLLLTLNEDSQQIPVPVPFADYQTVMSLADKGNLARLAAAADINYPDSQYFPDANAVDIDAVENFPVVIKPCLSQIWKHDYWLDTQVQIAYDRSQLRNFLMSSSWLRSDPFMLQEFIPGHGAGVFALYNHGRPVAFFSHRRLREKPPRGGVSVLSESIPLDPLLAEQTRKLLDAAGWHGVAMVEFRITDNGTAYLMEVNTRFWGSLQLAIDAGVDFPALLYRLTENQYPPPALPEYKTGVRLRWLLGDLDSLYLTIKDPRFSRREKLSRLLTFFMPHLLSTRHEINRLADFRPAIAELKQYIRDLSS